MAVLQRSSTYKAEGVVLSRRDLGDADRIVTLFTREFGRRRLVARGSRRPTSQHAPHIELFSRVRLVGGVGATLDVLTQAQNLEAYPRFREDLAAFAAAGWAVELLDGLSEDGEATPDAYAALVAFLGALNQRAADPEPLLSALALSLLDVHGYAPELWQCTVCSRTIEPGAHAFAPRTGGVICSTCSHDNASHPLSVDTLKTLRFIAHEGLTGAARLRADPRTRAELRTALRAYAASVVERDIASAHILERVGAGSAGPAAR
ncbi:MAG: DNA repair protein RecO, partial [Chloroflexi bacterium]|nr:DNA repair protein RecO [Chloroflexota bacterium]